MYTVHTHSLLPSALLSSYRTLRCSMTHPASGPPARSTNFEPKGHRRRLGFPSQSGRIAEETVYDASHRPGFEAKTLKSWDGAVRQGHQHDQEDVTLSAWRGSSREARLPQRSARGNDRRRPRTGDPGGLRVHHHPCFCICIGRLDVPRMHAVASPRCSPYSPVRREAEEGPAGKWKRAWVRLPDAVRLDRRLG